MGIGPGYKYRGYRSYDSGPAYAPPPPPLPNPNPRNFRVLEVQQRGLYYASRVHYPDCTNFEGEKVLITSFDPRRVSVLDPHFDESLGVVARFQPTKAGWAMALRFLDAQG